MITPPSRPPRPRAALASALLLVTLATNTARPADEKADDKARAAEAKKVDISKLPNDDLLKQAGSLYEKASGDYRSALRALTGADAQLVAASDQLNELAAPKITPKKSDGTAEDAAKAAVDAATAKAEFAKQKLKLTHARKLLQERSAGVVEAVQSASTGFAAVLDDLKPFALELSLRTKDGTLALSKLPEELQSVALEKNRKELAAEQDKFKDKLTNARKAVEADAKLVEDGGKAVVTAEAEATEASRVYGREQSRKELEKKYTGKKSETMLAEINQLVQDGSGLKGTYELAYQQFTTQSATADTLRKEFAEMKPLESKITQITRAEDVEPAVKATQAFIKFHSDRAAKLEALKAALTVVAKLGTEFEGDAAVSDDHLFKMQVVSSLLVKAGLGEQLPVSASPARLEAAAARAKQFASEVRASTEKAKAELTPIEKDLLEAKAAGVSATTQLTSLKESQEATLFALRFDEQLSKMATGEVLDQFQKLRKELTDMAASLKIEEAEYKKSVAAVTEARAKFDAIKDPFLRTAEEQGQAEKQKILEELRKDAGLDRVDRTMKESPVVPTPSVAEGKTPDAKKPDDREKPREQKLDLPPPLPLERATAQLAGFQQQLAARVRVMDEREEKAKVLLAALEDLDTKATTFSKTVNQTRQLALQLNAAAVAIKTRVGRGELDGSKVPAGITEAIATESRKKLDADATAVVNVVSQTRQERDALKKPDAQAEALRLLTKELLVIAGQRIDLLGDLKKLAADYQVAKKDRPESERKRLDQTAIDRMNKDAGKWDAVLALDKSKTALSLAELMESYYREVVELEDREDNIKKQKKAIDDLLELTGKERVAVQKGQPLLEKELSRLDSLKEEARLLARARLKPEAADELLKAYQAKSGRVLPKPLPLGEKDRSAQVDELAGELFERFVEAEAAKKWDAVLEGRLATAGITAEAGVYQDELAQLNAVSGANARRVGTLTGNAPPEPGKIGTGEQTKLRADSGEIGKTRGELEAVRIQGVQHIGIKLGVILLFAMLLPRFILFFLRRALGIGKRDEAGNPSMILTAIGAFLKAGVWVAAIALILSTLGFDVTAIVAGLGIGGLAIGLAAQPMIADVIGAVVIFAERRFKIGDVVKVGSDDPARIVGLTWRSTALRNADGLVVTVPNRKVTETSLINLTKNGQTYDFLTLNVTTTRDINEVLAVVKEAMELCKNLSPDHGVSIRKFNQKGDTKTAEYRFWWFLKDYDGRSKTRDEVFARIGAGLAAENMSGTEVTLA